MVSKLKENSSEGGPEGPRAGAVEGASSSVLNMACKRDGNYFKAAHSEKSIKQHFSLVRV